MNWHPTEDELILHFYGEGLPADEDRARVDDHLRVCARCEAIWHELSDTFGLMNTAAGPPEPGEDFERVMWARISRELPASPERWFSHRFIVAGALAACLVAMVAGGYAWIRTATRPVQVAETVPADAPSAERTSQTRERVLLTALNDHLSRAELLLTELSNSPAAEPNELDFERTTADDLVAAGRLYRQTAKQNGDVQFAQLLDDLEGVFVEVARSPAVVHREDLDFLRARIDDDSLLFKVRAVTAEVRVRQQTLMTLQ